MITYRFITYLIRNLKYSRILNKVYKDENILQNLSSLFQTEFKKDWIGRIYTVINPHIQNGVYDPNVQIYEYGENGLDNSIYVQNWIMERLNVASKFIQAQNLFDLLTYEIKKIDEYDNYLFIIQPITLPDCMEYVKKFTILVTILMVLGIGLWIFL
jgi:hypothetical protein